MQGKGVGTAMLARVCEHLDRYRTLAYLETDKRENLRFYEKFGFVVVAQAQVLGAPNWFMSRAPRFSA
jgi:GNAT superfamily N-acetyltransferase